MESEKFRGKYTGWGLSYKKGKPTKPFTRTQFQNSFIKKTVVPSYESYKASWDKIKYKPRKKPVPRYSGVFGPMPKFRI